MPHEKHQHEKHQHGHSHQHSHQHGHGHGHEDAFHGPEEVARVVADGEIAIGYVAEVVGLVHQLSDQPVRRVVDIGSGPGVATLELARLLPDATVLALDSSPSMTAAVDERAAAAGLAGRVSSREADVEAGLEDARDVDLVWASMSLHHVADEVGALRAIRNALSDHGVVAILEFGDQRRLVPPGDEALGDRLEKAYGRFFEEQSQLWHGDTPSGELAEMVGRAGLEVVDDHVSVITHQPPLDDAQRRYVTGSLMRARKQLASHLGAEDLDALERIAGDESRPDGPVVVSRRILLARLPRSAGR